MDTICALSSGGLPSGVAVIRVSGPAAADAARAVAGFLPPPRRAVLTAFRGPAGDILDRGLVLWFPSPRSFTGEDCVEFHGHGGRAAVAALLGALTRIPGIRLAEPGEFSRRAFENGKLDLTQVEGLSDLIRAETEAQRRQALAQAGGALSRRLVAWREALIGLRAEIEARLDFSDEDGVEEELGADFWQRLAGLHSDVASVLATAASAERVRDGFRVAIVGRPNAGKSTLLNALARREVAIVTDEPGTTRDVLEVAMDLRGVPVVLFDTAGLRETESRAEREGVRRARNTAEAADLLLVLQAVDAEATAESFDLIAARRRDGRAAWWVETKADLAPDRAALEAPVRTFRISALTGQGLNVLEAALAEAAGAAAAPIEDAVVSRARQRVLVEAAERALSEALEAPQRPEVLAELLRGASDSVSRLAGRIDVEDVLDRLFGEFCIGK